MRSASMATPWIVRGAGSSERSDLGLRNIYVVAAAHTTWIVRGTQTIHVVAAASTRPFFGVRAARYAEDLAIVALEDFEPRVR